MARKRPSKRDEPDTLANDARRVLNDPAFERVWSDYREGLIETIESGQSNGSPEFENAEREACRALRTLYALKTRMSGAVATQRLRDARDTDDQGGTT